MTADKVISVAQSFVGTVESPANSNNVIFNTHFYGHEVRDGKPKSTNKYPWCCTFVWDIFRIAGASSLFFDGKKTDYCPAVQDWAKTSKLTVDKAKGQKGDLVLFDWNANAKADHIGIILENKGGGVYTTIEGNTSQTSNDNGGKVMKRTRKTSEILMIIRPKYQTQKSDSKPVQKVESNSDKSCVPGKELTLKNANLYTSSSATRIAKHISGTYYLYDGKEINGRYRITLKPSFAQKSPAFFYVTGWINKGDI